MGPLLSRHGSAFCVGNTTSHVLRNVTAGLGQGSLSLDRLRDTGFTRSNYLLFFYNYVLACLCFSGKSLPGAVALYESSHLPTWPGL